LKLNEENASFLESVATILYLKNRNYKGARLQKRFKALKPNLSRKLPEAIEFATQLACG